MASTGMIQQVSDAQGRPVWLVSGHERVLELLEQSQNRRAQGSIPKQPISSVPMQILRNQQ